MGAKRSRRGRNKERGRGEGTAQGDTSTAALPRCVTQLQSEQYSELEEACGDLTFYATQARHHSGLLAAGVPQKLAGLLSTLPFDPAAVAVGQGDAAVLSRVHMGIVRFQGAAAEALRNLITNSTQDEAIDLLVTHQWADASGQPLNFPGILLSTLLGTWSLIETAHRFVFSGISDEDIPLIPILEAEQQNFSLDSDGSPSVLSRSRRLYCTLCQFYEQLLQLAVVSVDGSDVVAKAFSKPDVASQLLRQLQDSTTELWSVLNREPSVYAVDDEAEPNAAFLRREALLLVQVASGISDLLQTLSSDNEDLAACFTGGEGGVGKAQQDWLDAFVESPIHLDWLATQGSSPFDPALYEETPATMYALEREWILHQLLQSTLAIQGVLMNLFPSEANARRVLPLTVEVLSKFKPIQQWRHVLPLLMESCHVSEDLRSAVVRRTTSRIRAGKAAMEVLNICVAFVCEHNVEDEEDELAFQKNSLSALLYGVNALFVFGNVLKDALWMQDGGESDGEREMDALRQSEQRALRLAAQSNSEVTTMQFVILSAEVGVWNLASSLLLMVAATTLGDTRLIWRAIMTAVQQRSELLRYAYLVDTAAADPFFEDSPDKLVYSVATESPAARHLLWLQLKSLLQILWTLERKQSAIHGSYLDCPNTLAAAPADVDVLIRLAWESESPPALCQAAVATVGLLCSSLQTTDAATVAARFTSSMLHNVGGQVPLADLSNGVLRCGAPTQHRERQVWLGRLQRADELVTVRCEAANTLIDFFADERYDRDVYLPLGLHAALTSFFQQLRVHVASRQRVTKELWKNYRVECPPKEVNGWMEVLENLEGFLAYKKAHAM